MGELLYLCQQYWWVVVTRKQKLNDDICFTRFQKQQWIEHSVPLSSRLEACYKMSVLMNIVILLRSHTFSSVLRPELMWRIAILSHWSITDMVKSFLNWCLNELFLRAMIVQCSADINDMCWAFHELKNKP